jgi:hypothetical protein
VSLAFSYFISLIEILLFTQLFVPALTYQQKSKVKRAAIQAVDDGKPLRARFFLTADR